MSHRLLAGAAALALLAAPAVVAAEVHRYQTVDAVETASVSVVGSGVHVLLAITGTLDSGALHTAYYVGYHGDSTTASSAAIEGCQRMALMAVAKPGRFRLDVVDTATTRDPAYTRLVRCKLVRND
jgi:hypothetical protein